jgi:predicted Rossmann-fold nucleotide-binding protein
MECVSKAFMECPDRVPEGHTIGIIPAASIADPKTPKSGYPNPYIEIPILTHLASTDGTHFNSRNNINILTADTIIVLDGGKGTMAEVDLLCRFEKRNVAMSFTMKDDRFPKLAWAETEAILAEFIARQIT